MPDLSLTACNLSFRLASADAGLIEILGRIFAGMHAAGGASGVPIVYRIGRHPDGFTLEGDGISSVALGEDDLVYQVDKAITLELQHQRQDLFFLHAAALSQGSRVVVLAAPPGTGKSTLTLALTDLGLNYLSDELAPLELGTLAVHAYPHALCLKTVPPPPLRLPANAIPCRSRFHVPMAAPVNGPWTLATLVFLRRDDERFDLRPISAGSAAAMLMANALNPLAHEADGLGAAVRLAEAVPAFETDIADLPRAATAIRQLLNRP